MSIECLNQAIKVEGLPPTKKLILILLANYADDQNSCYPSYKHIAKLVGLKTVKGIQKTIKEFEQMGLLRVEHRILENGSYTSNKYYLTLGGGVIKEPTPMNDTRVGSQTTNNTKDNTKTNNQFEKFWKIYPRKIGKKTALQVFSKFDEKMIPKILHGTDCYAKEKINTEINYILHPTTFLRQERFMDYENQKERKITNLAG